MAAEMSVEEARRKLGDIVTAAAREHEVTIISKSGIPAAAVVSLAMLREGPGAGQLRVWARNIRRAADDLFTPAELAKADQVLAGDHETVAELLAASHEAGGVKWVARQNLYAIAGSLEERAGE